MSATLTHRCDEDECCYAGKPSPSGCGCHKTREQMANELIDELLRELGSLVEWLEDNQPWITGEFSMDELLAPARAVIAKATGATS